jgi:hypothetical protein
MQNLIKKIEKKFNVSIIQDTNYSDQSESFIRFEVNQDNTCIGKIIWRDKEGFSYFGENNILKEIVNFTK